MKIKSLLESVEYNLLTGNIETEIAGIAYDSRKVKKGFIFVCIKGMVTDGHKYINSSIKNGAVAIIVDDDIDIINGLTIIKVNNCRNVLANIADVFYDHPSRNIKIIGITGTKGKTTTSFMLKKILELAGQKVGLIGTINNMIGEEVLYTQRTTPESLDLNSIFHDMIEKKCDVVVMEVSSQGLMLDRVSYIDFDIGVFTNMSQAHIGNNEHKDFNDYLQNKLKLFSMCKEVIINIDNKYSDDFIKASKCPITTISIEQKADIVVENINNMGSYEEFFIKDSKEKFKIRLNIPGKFSIYNALTAASISLKLGINRKIISEALKDIHVPGRVEKVEINKDFTVIIDYAHSPNSLENILIAMNDVKKGRLVCMFGCGGNRDNSMRSMMGKISGKLADYTVITTDNPRSEEPDTIIDMIEEGIKKTKGKYIRITNRYEAIKYCIENARKDDLIILAGKGHETYQTFKNETIHFDEREVVKEIIEKMT